MSSTEYYSKIAKKLINIDAIPKAPFDRLQQVAKDLLMGEYCIDVHTHFFDMKCINSSYFVVRAIKDFLKFRGDSETEQERIIEDAYKKTDVYTDDWHIRLEEIMTEEANKRGGKNGVLFKLLWMKKMKKVYKYYIEDSSLATYFGLEKEKVLTTALMMDFKLGWGVDVGKSLLVQIKELKELSIESPTLPFLFCDPRRADLANVNENLYTLFDQAFAKETPFFGVKIYPCLGYDPSDHRLWPIYEICEKLAIPVLSHCGGVSVCTNSRELVIYQGDKEVVLKGKKRQEIGFALNDPSRWQLVLEKYPKLKLNIAHFGSDPTWSSEDKVSADIDPQSRKETIIDLMNKYENVYSDFSYTITDEIATENFVSKLKKKKIMKDRSMFGSDYWVVSKEGELKDNQRKFLDAVGDKKLIEKLCKGNPGKYLGISV